MSFDKGSKRALPGHPCQVRLTSTALRVPKCSIRAARRMQAEIRP
jgi:hypothetical protein